MHTQTIKRFIFLAAASLCVVCTAHAAPLPDPVVQHLASALDAARAQAGLPAVSAALITGDNGTWQGAAGCADIKNRQPVDTETLFSLGSITKTFVAALTLILHEQGALSLDDTVGQWLSDLPPNAARNINPSITIRRLMNHTSGIANYTERMLPWLALAVNAERHWSHSEVMRLIGPPAFAPGEGWRYSNSNYYILGMILEAAANAAAADALHAAVLDPLELRSTFLDAAEAVPYPIAHGYQYVFGRDVLDPLSVHRTGTYSLAWTAGALVSRPLDTARFLHELFAGNVLSPDALDEMLDTVPTDTASVEYGLGIMKIETTQYGTIWMHGGLINGYSATMWRVPAEGLSLAVTANRSSADVDSIAAALLDAFRAAR